MFSISVICVGKLKERFYADACDEYLKRLSAYANIDVVEVPEASGIHDQLERERAYIAKKLEKGAYIIPLCIEGEMLTSDSLADKFNTIASTGFSKIAFIIGGSVGIHDAIKSQGKLQLSMSRMTFPHHLARVMLLEQIYRAFQISSGGKYHK